MTNVLVSLKAPGPDGWQGAPGSITVTLLHRDITPDFIAVPLGFSVDLDDSGQALVDLPQVTPTDAWVFIENVPGLPQVRRVVSVPDTTATVGYEDLVDVDPTTLEPATSNVPGWTAAISQVQSSALAAQQAAADAEAAAAAAQGATAIVNLTDNGNGTYTVSNSGVSIVLYGVSAVDDLLDQRMRAKFDWAPSTGYAQNDVVTYDGSAWVCVTPHTSGATFTTANWSLLAQGVVVGTTEPGLATTPWVDLNA